MNMQDFYGRVFQRVVRNGDEIRFYLDDSSGYLMHHRQSCCENVTLEDVCGDLEDLVGHAILVAEEREERIGHDELAKESEYVPESYTWTFYELATIQGAVTIRWFGTSNGYYSETADVEEFGPMFNKDAYGYELD